METTISEPKAIGPVLPPDISSDIDSEKMAIENELATHFETNLVETNNEYCNNDETAQINEFDGNTEILPISTSKESEDEESMECKEEEPMENKEEPIENRDEPMEYNEETMENGKKLKCGVAGKSSKMLTSSLFTKRKKPEKYDEEEDDKGEKKIANLEVKSKMLNAEESKKVVTLTEGEEVKSSPPNKVGINRIIERVQARANKMWEHIGHKLLSKGDVTCHQSLSSDSSKDNSSGAVPSGDCPDNDAEVSSDLRDDSLDSISLPEIMIAASSTEKEGKTGTLKRIASSIKTGLAPCKNRNK